MPRDPSLLTTSFLPNAQYLNNSTITLRNKSFKYYWKILLIIGIFYGTPAIQYISYQLETRTQMGLKELEKECYFNYKCNSVIGNLWGFNNIISNIGYIFLGILYLYIIYRAPERSHEIFEDKNIYYSLGISLLLEGIFSSIYHICPNASNFQFDTTFMFIGSGLLLICLLQKRRRYKIIGIFKGFAFMSLCNILNVVELSENDNIIAFWSIVVTIFSVIIFLSVIILYHGKDNIISGIFTLLRSIIRFDFRIKNKVLFFGLLVTSIFNEFIVILSAIFKLHFSTFLLALIFINIFIVLNHYLFYKYKQGEKIGKKNIFFFITTICLMITSIYFFELPYTNKFLTPAESLALNRPCILFGYFDTHDVWHFLSAFGIFFMLLTTWYIDQ
tara:strand:- start:73 stop:1236 length:1164 start_codon:yes stop_codon:yes gene_type:complete